MNYTLEDLEIHLPIMMVEEAGDLNRISRRKDIGLNAMELRKYVSSTPRIRRDYHRLLEDELQDHQLHIAERILKMAKLQQKAFGDDEKDIPADPKTAIDLSKEISRLIAEGRGANMSSTSARVMASKEDIKEVLRRYVEDVV
jgi:hypothetical protein